MLILTGPTAAGKNTVGKLLACQRERCAVVDFDLVRAMFVHPHQPPWMGEEGKSQQMLGVRQVCNLAESFARAGWEVIILDVLSSETAQLYRSLLENAYPTVVQLLPAFDELKRRFYERGARLTDDELKMVYEEQSSLVGYDLRIDNTDIVPEKIAEMIASLL
jgi:adenylylsulfate kinase-like enzyme